MPYKTTEGTQVHNRLAGRNKDPQDAASTAPIETAGAHATQTHPQATSRCLAPPFYQLTTHHLAHHALRSGPLVQPGPAREVGTNKHLH